MTNQQKWKFYEDIYLHMFNIGRIHNCLLSGETANY
jgi:hypothetical protein